MTGNTHPSEEKSFNNWFRSEVAAAFAVGCAVVGAFIYLTNPVHTLETQNALLQQALDNIKNNDLTHIELEITATNARMDDLQKAQIIEGQQLTQILTILKK